MAGFEVRPSSSKKGKGLFATKPFHVGDIILQEEPLLSCQFAWNYEYKYSACEYCLRPLESPEANVRRLANNPDLVLPHPQCVPLQEIMTCDNCFESYCSEECKHKAFMKYHKVLCFNPQDRSHPIAILVDSWKKMHYPPETTNIMLLVKILAFIQESPEPSAAAATIKQFCHNTVNEDAELVHKLLGQQFSEQIATLRQLTINVINSDHVQNFLTPEGFCSLLALIGTNGQGIGTSPLAMWTSAIAEISMSDDEREQLDTYIDKLYEQIEEVSGSFLNTEGSGLYQVQSACNHSCDPNAESAFPNMNHIIQLRALKPIAPGEEIHISYLDECMLQRSRHSRQKNLSENYLFVCWCERCTSEANQPDCTSESSMSECDVDD